MVKSDASVVYQNIYRIIQQIPEGSVATYGQIARLAGIPGQPRRIGYALSISSENNKTIPWHRVVNAKGEVSRRWELDSVDLQKILLKEEGIIFDNKGRINLGDFQWKITKI